MADGYENGFRPVSGSQNGADRFTLVRQKRIVSPAVPGRFVPADQATLGTSDRRNVKQHTQVAGQPKPPWMSKALAVTNQQIGGAPA
jgi:hypothetical protein